MGAKGSGWAIPPAIQSTITESAVALGEIGLADPRTARGAPEVRAPRVAAPAVFRKSRRWRFVLGELSFFFMALCWVAGFSLIDQLEFWMHQDCPEQILDACG